MESHFPNTAPTPRPWSIRLWHLFVVTLAVAIWLAIFRVFPNSCVVIAVSIVPAMMTYVAARLFRIRRVEHLSTIGKTLILIVLSCFWFFFYVLSAGPVVALIQALGMSEDAAYVLYGPVSWLWGYTFLGPPLQWYMDLWGV